VINLSTLQTQHHGVVERVKEVTGDTKTYSVNQSDDSTKETPPLK